ncbi:MAG: type II toxin-antitoxin system VapC family toxin [Actinomycetes bacterium]
MTGPGIIDTSVVIELPNITDPSLLPAVPLITTITLAELSVGPLVTDDRNERVRRQRTLQQAESDFEPLAFDAAAARALGGVAAGLRASGRKSRARAYDALIAACAISRDLPVYTMNPADFAHIENLTVVSVPHPTAR